MTMDLVEKYERDVLTRKKKYRIPDNIGNPKQVLRKLFPKHQQLDGARRIAVHMDVENNTSTSFNYFVSGVKNCVRMMRSKLS